MTAPALAHVTASPSFVVQGSETDLQLAVPNERVSHSTTELTVTLPTGLDVVTVTSPPGWEAISNTREVTWSGGRIEGTRSEVFGLRVDTIAAPGTVNLNAVQRYEDGADVSWKTSLTIVPGDAASDAGSSRRTLAIGAAALVVASTLVALRRLRRRID